MKLAKCLAAGLLWLLSILFAANVQAQDATTTTTGCDTVNGTQFNLEPRPNAVPQNSESVAFLLNKVGAGEDLIVGSATEFDLASRSRFVNNPAAVGVDVLNAFYVHRSGAGCTPNLEGSLNQQSFTPTFLAPSVVADPVRGSFALGAILGTSGVLLQRTTAATLLSTTACPSGTETILSAANSTCWPTVAVASFNPNFSNNLEVLSPQLAFDTRASGTGAGDLYVAAQVLNASAFPATSSIQILSCSGVTLNCSVSPLTVSGADTFGAHPWIQVRQDGAITISYWTFTRPFGQLPNPIDIKFVTCKPNGAPAVPTCSKPLLVTAVNVVANFNPGDNNFGSSLFPKHVSRRDAGGGFTTFLIYDRCRSLNPPEGISGTVALTDPVCTKVDVAMTLSTNGGTTWSLPAPVISAVGHQFFGSVALDASTSTTNIAYYSTQNDPFLQRSQIFLSQILPGSTTAEPAIALTSASTDPNAGIQNFIVSSATGVTDFGDRIGIAAAGTGTKGQSRVYVHYTWNNVFGTSSGTQQPDQNNTLVQFSY
ncbi:MAG TPA: hypothetical protein VFO39_20170 [Candidatus Sulfotelmatobacter sp.]|nr:hypothetical protein [Candidatus Sulfotelmatobacter sp.]